MCCARAASSGERRRPRQCKPAVNSRWFRSHWTAASYLLVTGRTLPADLFTSYTCFLKFVSKLSAGRRLARRPARGGNGLSPGRSTGRDHSHVQRSLWPAAEQKGGRAVERRI